MSRLPDFFDVRSDMFRYFFENFIFQRNGFVVGGNDETFSFFEFGCIVTFSVGDGLFADIVFRNKMLVGVCNFNKIAENFVVADL